MLKHPALIAVVVATALVSGCKKKPVEDVGDGGLGSGASIEQTLQVTTVQPSSVPVGQPSQVQVLGSGFVAGTTVQVGPQRAAARFLNANVLELTVPGLAAGTYDVTVANPDGQQALLRSGLRVGDVAGAVRVDVQRCGLVVVYFDTDQAGLTGAARSALDSVTDCYTAPGGTVQVLGHADERGTTDYNVALGQRRAEAVVDYLGGRGVERGRLAVTSLGEERPADRGHSEAAWAKNRRVELVLR